MSHPSALLKRALIFTHRWLGVVLAVVFFLWFSSGIVMMYWSFPEVETRDRLERAPILKAAQIQVSVEEAYAKLGRTGPVGQVRLTSFAGRPVYRFTGGGRRGGAADGNEDRNRTRGRGDGSAMVYADDGTVQAVVDDELIDRVASLWAGRPVAEATKAAVTEVDQWTVGNLRNVRPLFKYSWPDGQQVYVNGTTAEVGQYTTTASRFWAWLGAIPHWLYFTPLRKHQPQWSSFVIWSSGIGTIASLLGVIVAIWMLSPQKRYRHAGAPTMIPYRGWKRWHTIVGLVFGVLACTWAFSGMLSMGSFAPLVKLTDLMVPAPPRETGENAQGEGRRGRNRGGAVATALRGRGPLPLSAFEGRSAADALGALDGFDVKELEYSSFAGEPIYVATSASGDTRVVPMQGAAMASLDQATVMRIVREAAGDRLAELRVMTEYDAYYLDRRGERPLPVIYARMNDAVSNRYYIDPRTASVVGSYNARNWVSRWLYHGLHSLDFPWLYKYRPLWDIVVITLMLGGTVLCMTSLVLAWRVLVRKVVALLPARKAAPSEDLAFETER